MIYCLRFASALMQMKKQQNQIRLLNPLKNNFSVMYDVNGDGNPIEFTAKAGEITPFEEVVGNHVRKHLVEEIINTRSWQRYRSWENARNEIYAEITK